MKKTVLNLTVLALMAIVSLVSCDKEQLSVPEPAPDKSKTVINVSVIDSMISTKNGLPTLCQRNSYDSLGRPSRSVRYRYNNGVLTDSAVYTYDYDKYEKDCFEFTQYTCVNGDNNIKRVIKRYGTGKDITRTAQVYYDADGQWLIIESSYSKRENDMIVSKNERYGILDGQRVLISRHDSTIVFYAGTDSVSNLVASSYTRQVEYDKNDILNICLKRLGKGVWVNSETEIDSKGSVLRMYSALSSDSITWTESEYVRDLVFNVNGDLLEETEINDGVNDTKRVVTYAENGLKEKVDYYVWSENDKAFEFIGSAKYVRLESGQMDSLIINCNSNRLTPLRLPVEGDMYGMVPMSFVENRLIRGDKTCSRCLIKCDSNGNPIKETMYREQPDGTEELIAEATSKLNDQGIFLEYEVKLNDQGAWTVILASKRTYDSEWRVLNTYDMVLDSTEDLESEYITETRREYDSFGNSSYSYRHSHSIRKKELNGKQLEVEVDEVEEVYYSTIERILD